MTVVDPLALAAPRWQAASPPVVAGLPVDEAICSTSWKGESDDDEEEGDERERDPDVTWQKETVSRSVVEDPTPDEVEAPFGER